MTDEPTTYSTPPNGHVALEDLSALLDGELAAAPRGKIEAHLESCGSCRGERERLADVRRVLGELVTAPPVGASAAAIAASLVALGEVGEAKAGEARAVGRLAPSGRRQRRLRLIGVAAAVVLVVGGVSGIVLEMGRGSGSTSGTALSPYAVHRAAASGEPAGAALSLTGSLVQLRTSTSTRGPGALVAELGRDDVAALRVRRAPGGGFTATIVLEAAHSLSEKQVDQLRRRPASAVVRGRDEGSVDVLSRRTVEVEDLSRAALNYLKRLLN